MELTTSNLIYHGLHNLDNLSYTREQAEVVYRLLLSLGATRDIKFNWDEVSGKIHIMKKFICVGAIMESEDMHCDQYYTLDRYLRLLIRFDKAAHNRAKNVERLIRRMEERPKGLRKQLSN